MILCCVVIPSARVVNQLLTPNLGETKQNQREATSDFDWRYCPPFLSVYDRPGCPLLPFAVGRRLGQAGRKWRGSW